MAPSKSSEPNRFDRRFLKYSKERRSSSNHVGTRNVPSEVCYNDTKHYQVASENEGKSEVCKNDSQRHCVNPHDICFRMSPGVLEM